MKLIKVNFKCLRTYTNKKNTSLYAYIYEDKSELKTKTLKRNDSNNNCLF